MSMLGNEEALANPPPRRRKPFRPTFTLTKYQRKWFIATTIAMFAFMALPLLTGTFAQNLFCPRSSLLCLSSTSARTALLTFSPMALLVSSVFLMSVAPASVKWLMAIIYVGLPTACVAEAYSLYTDARNYVSVEENGVVLGKVGSQLPTRYAWSDATQTTAWCESGSESGPKINAYFAMRNGMTIGVPYRAWRNIAERHPALRAATNEIPYRTRNLDWCAHYYDHAPPFDTYVPLKALN